jgi:ribose transport system substrate-binding protein
LPARHCRLAFARLISTGVTACINGVNHNVISFSMVMSTTNRTRDPYLVKSLVHASQVLGVFQAPGETLRLRDIAIRSGLNKGMVFRLLYTLERCGMVEKIGDNQYQSCLRPVKQRRYRFGYAAQGTDYQFSRDVSEGLRTAAASEGIELISVDNRYNAATAQRNAELLIREKVDLMIEFQTDETVAPIIAAKFREAEIPLIAIDIPHPGATYFGANNYGAGLIGGRYLGRWAKQNWQGIVEEIILLELPRAGSLPRMRLTGMLVGMKETLPSLDSCPVTYIDGDGQFGQSFEMMRKHLRSRRQARVLLGAINDSSALGGMRAFQEVGRAEHCAVMGQNASPEARAELREPSTRMIGSVAYFPERYGRELVRLAVDLLSRRAVPPAVFMKHQLITPETVDHFYPNDSLMAVAPV